MSDLVKQKRGSESSSRSAKLDTGQLLFDLANMRDDGTVCFRRKWDRLYSRYSNRELLMYRDELTLLWGHVAPFDPAEVHDQPAQVTLEKLCAGMTNHQTRLFKNWLNGVPRCGESLECMICREWLRLEKDALLIDWTPSEKRIRANPRSLPTVLAWACVHGAEHLRLCLNPSCAAPYFVATRKDQKYCSSECAWPAKKAAKLKWWHEHTDEKKRPLKTKLKRGIAK